MHGNESRNARARKSLQLALAVSLLLHAAVLFIGYPPSDPVTGPATQSDKSTAATRPRLLASLAPPLQVAPPVARRPAAPKALTKQKKLSAPTGVWANRSWTKAERADMDNFLKELDTQAKPPAGRELSRKAMAMARQLGRTPQDDGEDETLSQPAAGGKPVEPFSLEMYFDAFVRKMNRSAAFVKNDPRVRGRQKALVKISLNPDGSLKEYRVLRSGDQEAEIAYIKSVIDRASPFSAFPPDIRSSRDSLTILMCIYPPGAGGGGGFSRSFGGQDCKD